jgi:tetratricopeptide (TPR) repeat protein
MSAMERRSRQVNIWQYGGAFFYLWSARIHRHFGIVFAEKREYASAVRDYTRALKSNPRLARAYLERGILLWRELGQAEQAIGDFTVALRLDSAWPEALFFRGLAHQGISDYPAAIGDLSSYLDTGDRSWRDNATRQLHLMRMIWDGLSEEQKLK